VTEAGIVTEEIELLANAEYPILVKELGRLSKVNAFSSKA
jgi:hypothetical protein